MFKIRCYMITKAKKVKIINIRESRPYLIYGEGVYKLDGKKVNLSYKEGKINPTPELLYFENDPLPYDSTGEVAEEEKLVRDTFLKNFFESTAESGKKGSFIGIFSEHAKLWVTVGLIALVVIGFFMAGGFKGRI
jgi:hypothetical protein